VKNSSAYDPSNVLEGYGMTPQEALEYFDNNQTTLAKAAGVKQPSVFGWIKRGRIPNESQLVLEEVTQGLLRADDDVPRGWTGVK